MTQSNQLPELSIVIPTINSGEFIRRTLTRIIQQDPAEGAPYEIILVNDCSQDDTVSAIRDIIKEFPHIRIRLISNPRAAGQAISTINGLRVSQGRFAITFDDDLQYDPNDIRVLFLKLSGSPGTDILCGHRSSQKNYRLSDNIFRFVSVSVLALIFPRHFRKKYFTSFKAYRMAALHTTNGELRNIFYFWKFAPSRILPHTVNHHKSIRGKSNYSIPKKLREFNFLIFKMTQRASYYTAAGAALISATDRCISVPAAAVAAGSLMTAAATAAWLQLQDRRMIHSDIINEQDGA